MLYYRRLAVAVDHVVTPGPDDVGNFLFWLIIFFSLVLSLKLQISQNVSYSSLKLVSEVEGSREDGEMCRTIVVT